MTKPEFLAQEQLDIQTEYKELRNNKMKIIDAIEELSSKYYYPISVIKSLVFDNNYYHTESTRKKLKTETIAIAS